VFLSKSGCPAQNNGAKVDLRCFVVVTRAPGRTIAVCTLSHLHRATSRAIPRYGRSRRDPGTSWARSSLLLGDRHARPSSRAKVGAPIVLVSPSGDDIIRTRVPSGTSVGRRSHSSIHGRYRALAPWVRARPGLCEVFQLAKPSPYPECESGPLRPAPGNQTIQSPCPATAHQVSPGATPDLASRYIRRSPRVCRPCLAAVSVR